MVLFATILILGFFLFRQYDRIEKLEQTNANHVNNIHALGDSLEQYRGENDELVAEKGALKTTVDDLEILNGELAAELEKEHNKPRTVTQVEYVIEGDTGEVPYTDWLNLTDNTYKIHWEDNNEGEWGLREIAGHSTFDITEDNSITALSTKITKDRLAMRLVTGFREIEEGENKGHLQIYARTSFPGVRFTKLDGAILDPNEFADSTPPKRWGIGPVIGGGLNSQMQPAPFVGVGITYSFIRW